MVLDSGSYVVQLFDKFSANMSLLVIAIFEFVSVTWLYGFNRWEFYDVQRQQLYECNLVWLNFFISLLCIKSLRLFAFLLFLIGRTIL